MQKENNLIFSSTLIIRLYDKGIYIITYINVELELITQENFYFSYLVLWVGILLNIIVQINQPQLFFPLRIKKYIGRCPVKQIKFIATYVPHKHYLIFLKYISKTLTFNLLKSSLMKYFYAKASISLWSHIEI